jgi:hypothetical protein
MTNVVIKNSPNYLSRSTKISIKYGRSRLAIYYAIKLKRPTSIKKGQRYRAAMRDLLRMRGITTLPQLLAETWEEAVVINPALYRCKLPRLLLNYYD